MTTGIEAAIVGSVLALCIALARLTYTGIKGELQEIKHAVQSSNVSLVSFEKRLTVLEMLACMPERERLEFLRMNLLKGVVRESNAK